LDNAPISRGMLPWNKLSAMLNWNIFF
jgi:hypothetical protein